MNNQQVRTERRFGQSWLQTTIEYDWTKVTAATRFRLEWKVRLIRLPSFLARLAVAPLAYLVFLPVVAFIVAVAQWIKEWWTHQPFTSL